MNCVKSTSTNHSRSKFTHRSHWKVISETPAPHSDVEIGSTAVIQEAKGGDEALRFLKNQHVVGELTAEEEKKLVRKIDWMIMPLMWTCYCLQYLDKTLGKAGMLRF
jgi:hypothetical protein